MKRTIVLEDQPIAYTLERKSIKSIRVHIRRGELFVSAPHWVPLRVVESFVRSRSAFILGALGRAEPLSVISCDDGARLPYLGRELTLVLSRGKKASASVTGDELRLALRSPEESESVRHALDKWYRDESERLCRLYIDRLYPQFAPLGVPYPEIRMRVMRAAWGNCRPKSGVVTFNARLAGVPEACIEYVVAHELTHFLRADHSPAFYDALGRVIPDWKARRKELRRYSALLS